MLEQCSSSDNSSLVIKLHSKVVGVYASASRELSQVIGFHILWRLEEVDA